MHQAWLLLSLLLLAPIHIHGFFSLFPGHANGFVQPKHAPGVKVVDNARHDLPKVRMGERVIDLTSAVHFDNLMQDTPDELRPPSLIMFHGFETCPDADQNLHFRQLSETKLPSRERLMTATYDIDANPVRAWFKFTPEMDLAKRFGIDKKACPTLVFVPRGSDCDGFTEWCTEKTDDPLIEKVGCENFVDKCAAKIVKWNGKGNWADWTMKLVKEQGEPQISPVLGSYADQNRWLRERDETTSDNELRNYFLVEGFPAFTKTGFLAMPTPKVVQDFFLDFFNRRLRHRRMEVWHSGSTQMGFHDVPTSFISLDMEGQIRDKLANEVIKPIVEKWSGMSPLELTSFYGLREYKNNSWLRGHIDRIDTHVLSVTFVVSKTNATNIDHVLTPDEANKLPKWPLEVYAYDGNIYRHEHPPDTMILYESSKLIHGRPYKNRGPDHVGAFCHFKPTKMDSIAAAEWDNIASFARANQAKNTQRGKYRETPVVEPSQPIFSSHQYGEGTGFQSHKKDVSSAKTSQKERMLVTMSNGSNKNLQLAWIDPSGDYVVQGEVSPNANVQIETHMGHKFVWLDPKTSKPVPQGMFEIEAGSRTYKYNSKFQNA